MTPLPGQGEEGINHSSIRPIASTMNGSHDQEGHHSGPGTVSDHRENPEQGGGRGEASSSSAAGPAHDTPDQSSIQPTVAEEEVEVAVAPVNPQEASRQALAALLKDIHDETVAIDDDVLDRLLKLGQRAFSSSATSSPTTTPRSSKKASPSSASAGIIKREDALSWYAHLLETVAESELGGPPCTLHRARLAAIHRCAAFFVRLKNNSNKGGSKKGGGGGGGGGLKKKLSKLQLLQQQSAPPFPPSLNKADSSLSISSSSTSTSLRGLSSTCQDELRRRLLTFYVSLQMPQSPKDREILDIMRRDNLLASLRWLESPLAPLEITLRSLLLPLLEGLCEDVLMSTALGEEVRTRLELELGGLEHDIQQRGSPGLWQTADSFWRLATSKNDQRLIASPLIEDAAPRVDSLIHWLHEEALKLRSSCASEEVLVPLPRDLRSTLKSQVYTSPSNFFRVFQSHQVALSSIRLPSSAVGCLPQSPPFASPSRGSMPDSSIRECLRLGPSLSQALKDAGRERFTMNGEAVPNTEIERELTMYLETHLIHQREEEEGGSNDNGKAKATTKNGNGSSKKKGKAAAPAAASTPTTTTITTTKAPSGVSAVQRFPLAASRTSWGGDVFFIIRNLMQHIPCSIKILYNYTGAVSAVQRSLLAASRTSWGGDVFFIIRDLFGGDGVVVAPVSTGGHPVDIHVLINEDEAHEKEKARKDEGVEGRGRKKDEGADEMDRKKRDEGAEERGRKKKEGAVMERKVLIKTKAAYGLFVDEGLSRVPSHSSLATYFAAGNSANTVASSLGTSTAPLVILRATLVETIPLEVVEGQVIATKLGTGRLLSIQADDPTPPTPPPPSVSATGVPQGLELPGRRHREVSV